MAARLFACRTIRQASSRQFCFRDLEVAVHRLVRKLDLRNGSFQGQVIAGTDAALFRSAGIFLDSKRARVQQTPESISRARLGREPGATLFISYTAPRLPCLRNFGFPILDTGWTGACVTRLCLHCPTFSTYAWNGPLISWQEDCRSGNRDRQRTLSPFTLSQGPIPLPLQPARRLKATPKTFSRENQKSVSSLGTQLFFGGRNSEASSSILVPVRISFQPLFRS